MSDRDRLAALIDDALSAMDDEWLVRDLADTLIAAGVGFPALDVERLARALVPSMTPVMDDLGVPNEGGEWTRGLAAVIAREYAALDPEAE